MRDDDDDGGFVSLTFPYWHIYADRIICIIAPVHIIWMETSEK